MVWQLYFDEIIFIGIFLICLEFGNLNVFLLNIIWVVVFSDFYDVINVVNNVIEVIFNVDSLILDQVGVCESFIVEVCFVCVLFYFYLV